MSKEAKFVRGQVRQVIKEIFPDVLGLEVWKTLEKIQQDRLDLIHKMVKETLERIDSRQKDVQSLIMREVAAGAAKNLAEKEQKSE